MTKLQHTSLLALLVLSIATPNAEVVVAKGVTTSQEVGPLRTGANALLTTCPTWTAGQLCTDTQVVVIERNEADSPATTTVSFLQYTYIVDGALFVTAMFGSGPATLSITPPLSEAALDADIELRVCDSDFQCSSIGTVNINGEWTATGPLEHDNASVGGGSGTLRIHAGLAQERPASASIAVGGVTLPGVVLPGASIFRDKRVDICLSIYPWNC